MTQEAGNLSGPLRQAFTYYMQNINQYKYVADIDEWKVLHIQQHAYLVVTSGGGGVGFFHFSTSDTRATLENVYVHEAGSDFLAKVIWFIRTRLNYHTVGLGKTHSQDTIAVLKKIHHRFDVWWEDDEGNTELYDPATTDKYYGKVTKTKWSVVLENTHLSNDNWPMKFQPIFENGNDLLKCSYEGFCDGDFL